MIKNKVLAYNNDTGPKGFFKMDCGRIFMIPMGDREHYFEFWQNSLEIDDWAKSAPN